MYCLGSLSFHTTYDNKTDTINKRGQGLMLDVVASFTKKTFRTLIITEITENRKALAKRVSHIIAGVVEER